MVETIECPDCHLRITPDFYMCCKSRSAKRIWALTDQLKQLEEAFLIALGYVRSAPLHEADLERIEALVGDYTLRPTPSKITATPG
jgi:hypothetical protein